MGLWDPERDPEDTLPKTINSQGLMGVLSKTNDLTLSSINSLQNVFNRDLYADINRVNNIIGKVTGAMSSVITDPVIQNPNELVADTVPPLDAFETCQKVKGLSVWDERGLWHCLFPRSVIPYKYDIEDNSVVETGDHSMLSREDIENDASHEHGIWFNNIQDLLTWKVQMRNAINAKNNRQWKKWRSNEADKWKSLLSFDNEDENTKKVVSRQMESRTQSLDTSDDLKRVTIMKTVYSDGSSNNIEKTEILGSNGEIKSSSEKNI